MTENKKISCSKMPYISGDLNLQEMTLLLRF